MIDKRLGVLLIRLSFPAALGMIIYSMFCLVDTFFVARLGAQALAALTLSLPIQILITTTASASGAGITSLLARTLGQGDVKKADNIAWHGLIMIIAYGLIFFLLGNRFIDDILIFSGSTPDTFELCLEYMRILLPGCIFTFIPIILGSIIQGEGNTVLPVLVALAGICLNVVLDPILIFGMGSFAGMGLAGAALASVLAQFVSSFVMVVIVMRRRGLLSWARVHFRPDIKVLYGIYAVGFPSMITEIVGVLSLLILNKILAPFGYHAAAALGIFLRIRSFAFMPVLGLAQGVMPIAGFAYGAGHFDRVKETLVKAVVLTLIVMGGAWLAIYLYPSWIIGFFSHEAELSRIGITCLLLSSIFLPLMGPMLILSTVLQAIGKGTIAMWLYLSRQLVFFLLPLLILPRYLGLNGVWLTFSLSELLAGLFSLVFFLQLWQELRVSRRRVTLIGLPRSYVISRIIAWLKW